MAAIFWWIVFPYVTLTIMIAGLLYRFVYRRITWYAPSTEIHEKGWLKIGSPLFHWGIIFAFIGHVMGILIPRSFYEAAGISDETYHAFAIAGGGLAGLMVVAGLIILLLRKLFVERVRVHASFADYFTFLLLLIVGGIGTYITLIYDTTVMEFEYRTTIGPWFRSLFVFQPKYQLMLAVPAIFKLHVIAGFLLFASIPFTRLVHIFSFPARYPTRAPIQYRSRSGYKKN
ncbi:MAG TPA: respiratory nitrate reductase subunit gamma [Bacilli bacterium]